MRDWKQIRVDASIEVYFCDPHAPWQRGSNENTNGLLRQYFPSGTDFAAITEAQLDAVADELNDRPRKRLGFAKPIEEISKLLFTDRQNPPNELRNSSCPPISQASGVVGAQRAGPDADGRPRVHRRPAGPRDRIAPPSPGRARASLSARPTGHCQVDPHHPVV